MYSVTEEDRLRETLASRSPCLTLFRPRLLQEIDLPHVVIAGFLWALAEPARNLFLFLPIDVDLARESEFFLEQQMCLVHSFALTICAVVEKKFFEECRIVEGGGLKNQNHFSDYAKLECE